MSQMTPMPMLPPAQPVRMMQFGGEPTQGEFSDTDLSDAGSFDFSSPDSGSDFDVGFTEEEDPSRTEYQVDDSGIFTGTEGGDDDPPPVIDTRPRTNIRNVGPTSNLRYDPQFTANLLQQRGLDPQGFMSPADFQQTTQGGGTGTAQTLSSGLPSLGLGQNLLGAKPTISRQDVLTAQNRLSDIAPAATVPLAPTSPFFDRDLLDDPLGLGVNTRFGSPFGNAVIQGFEGAKSSPTQIDRSQDQASLLTTIPGLRGVPQSIDTVADDLVAGQGKGANINNPGNIRAGGGFDGEIGTTKDGFAIFDNLQSGVNAINTLTDTYGSKRNVDTVREYANRYSPVGENTAKEVAGKINVLSNALGVGPDDKVDFTDPAVQAKLTPAVMTTEIGADKTRDVLNVLSGFSPTPLARDQVTNFNPNLTTPVNQLDTLDPPIGQTQVGIPPVGEQRAGSRGDIVTPAPPPAIPVVPQDMQDIIRQDENLARIEREQQAIQDARNTGRPTFNLGPGQPGVDIRGPLAARLASVLPDQELETLQGARGQRPAVDTVYDSPPIFGLIDRTPDLDTTKSFVGTNIDPEPFTGPRKDIPNVGMIGGRRDPTLDTGELVAELTLDDARAMGNINQERVADILARPDRFKETFKIGDVEFPNLIATLANKAGSFFDRRLFDGIVSKGLDAVVDPDTGRIIGAKDEFGNLIEGRDLDQFQAGDDNQDPVTKFLKKATEEKDEEEDEKPPNVIGGTTPTEPTPRPPTVVKSTAPASTASFTPVDFDAGSLNDLIARITGVPAPKRLQEGGVVNAVDNFLNKVA
jgi:hypothetical protein